MNRLDFIRKYEIDKTSKMYNLETIIIFRCCHSCGLCAIHKKCRKTFNNYDPFIVEDEILEFKLLYPELFI